MLEQTVTRAEQPGIFFEDPYKVLGLPASTDFSVVKKQYRKLAKQYHPDKFAGESSKFQMIQHAYEKIVKMERFKRQVFNYMQMHSLRVFLNEGTKIFGCYAFRFTVSTFKIQLSNLMLPKLLTFRLNIPGLFDVPPSKINGYGTECFEIGRAHV